MKLSKYLIVISIITTLASCNKSKGNKEIVEEENITKEVLSNELKGILQKHKIVGSSVYVIFNDSVYTFNYGKRNIEKNLKVNDDTKFRIASISKTVTAIATMQLLDKKLLDLDEDISKYLGYEIVNNNYPENKISTRMLLSHTSSIIDNEEYQNLINNTFAKDGSTISMEEFFSSKPDIYSPNKPGTFFQYSNLNYAILGSVIEAVSKVRFDKYVFENILKPLEIDAGFNVNDIKNLEDIATLYRKGSPTADDFNNKPPKEKDLNAGVNGLYFGPQGSLRISAVDLSKIMMMLMNYGKFGEIKILSEQAVRQMESNQWQYNGNNGDNYHNLFNSWGLGMHRTTKSKNGDYIMKDISFVGHPGEAYGLISDMYYNRDKKLGFIFISNGTYGPSYYTLNSNSAYYEVEFEIFKCIERNTILRK